MGHKDLPTVVWRTVHPGREYRSEWCGHHLRIFYDGKVGGMWAGSIDGSRVLRARHINNARRRLLAELDRLHPSPLDLRLDQLADGSHTISPAPGKKACAVWLSGWDAGICGAAAGSCPHRSAHLRKLWLAGREAGLRSRNCDARLMMALANVMRPGTYLVIPPLAAANAAVAGT
jgi:ribosome modulation factor